MCIERERERERDLERKEKILWKGGGDDGCLSWGFSWVGCGGLARGEEVLSCKSTVGCLLSSFSCHFLLDF